MKKTKKKRQTKKEFIPKIGDDVIVYGGGKNTTEFEDATEAVVHSIQDGLFMLMFDDGHFDEFHPQQLRPLKRRAGAGAL